MKKRTSLLMGASALLVAALFASPAHATTITGEVLALGGTTYRSVYAVTNDGSLGPGTAIELFDILFDPGLYLESSLAIVTPAPLNTAWDQLVLGSAPGVPAAFDALALAGGILAGGTASGFAVEYEWLGLGTPGAQAFEVYDPGTFALLERGLTTDAQVSPVPEPAAFWLLASGLVGLMGLTAARAVRASRHLT